MPVWFYGRTVGRFFSKNNDDDEYDEIEEELAAGSDFKEIAADTDSSSGAGGKRTPNTDDDDFELLEKSVEDVGAKATGSQPQAKAAKSNKRKNKRK